MLAYVYLFSCAHITGHISAGCRPSYLSDTSILTKDEQRTYSV